MKKVLKFISQTALGIGAVLTIWAGKAMAGSAQDGANAARADSMPAELVGSNGVFTNITNTILYIVGVISVIMLIYGGLRYIISGGDSKKVTDAKNTILYAIIGLIIAILSYAIVNFVLNSIGANNPENHIETTEQIESQSSE